MMKLKALAQIAVIAAIFLAGQAFSQSGSLEVSDVDGLPVLIKHLPDWEARRDSTVFARDAATLRSVLGDRSVIALIDFSTGTEAVTAPYDVGRLLIVEYTNPQSSIDADGRFQSALSGDAGTVYRRIGNYNAFVFDVADVEAANALLDQVKYEKNVHWLGEDPFADARAMRAERAFVITTSDIFLSTLIWILGGLVISIVTGILAGLIYYRLSEQKRSQMAAFSDAGGMVRLNLDGLSADDAAGRMLSD